jgi:hypothetical protein
MSKIREILEPKIEEYRADAVTNTDEAYGQGIGFGSVCGVEMALDELGKLDANLDTLRAVVQQLIDDCDAIMNRRAGAQQTNGNTWAGMSINAARDIKQRAGVMLRLLDGEEI